MTYSILFLGKADDEHTAAALQLCKESFVDVHGYLGRWGEPIPDPLLRWRGDLIISYLSRWIVPAEVLSASSIAINFHPAPPEYPGVGCINFALYEGASQYGVTCHHMAAKVDSGPIVATRRFAVSPEDNVQSLLQRTYLNQFDLFQEVINLLARGLPLPRSDETWTRPPFRRTELDSLSRITPDMTALEIARRIRATTYASWRPFVEVAGYRFSLDPVS